MRNNVVRLGAYYRQPPEPIKAEDIIDTTQRTMAQLQAARDLVAAQDTDGTIRRAIAERCERKGIKSTVEFLRQEVKILVEISDTLESCTHD